MLIPSSPILGFFLILNSTSCAPRLLKPNLFIKASSSTNLNTRGLGFPY